MSGKTGIGKKGERTGCGSQDIGNREAEDMSGSKGIGDKNG